MKCPYCKEENPPGNLRCSFCGQPLTQSGVTAGPNDYVPDYLVQSILVTLCCCIPFGIVAIVYAARVKAYLLGGQYAMAREASDKAKMWGWIGFLVGIVFGIMYVLLVTMTTFLEEL